MVRAPAPRAQYSAETSARLEAVLGLDPRTTLDKLRDAQKETSTLQGQRAEVLAELASYEARYSYPSHWEHERKALLSRLVESRRMEMAGRGEKITEAGLDSYAHAHDEYRSFLGESRRERTRMEELKARLARLNAQVETAKGVEEYYSRHARLNESLVYFSGKEMGLS
jgi:hypothetical protein